MSAHEQVLEEERAATIPAPAPDPAAERDEIAPLHNPAPTPARRRYLVAEFVILFGGGPMLYYFDLVPVHPFLGLYFFTILCTTLLLFDRSFDRSRFLRVRGSWPSIRAATLLFLPLAAALTAALVIFEPERLFSLIRNRPGVWLMVMCLYPILSVYPQELIYRTFLFHRYRHIFTRPWVMISASALTFGYMHILFDHWISVALTIIGGYLFAWTYHRSQSTFAAWVEHTLWGCFIFTIGLGWYFFTGRAAVPS